MKLHFTKIYYVTKEGSTYVFRESYKLDRSGVREFMAAALVFFLIR